jgi:hypothetical protein
VSRCRALVLVERWAPRERRQVTVRSAPAARDPHGTRLPMVKSELLYEPNSDAASIGLNDAGATCVRGISCPPVPCSALR